MTYDYQYGVLKSIDYPAGQPDMTRVINSNGTVKQETVAGVRHDFTYDDDFRLTGISGPDENETITWAKNSVTHTQGERRSVETYDAWGRLIRESIRRSNTADQVRSLAYDGLGRLSRETLASGVQYEFSYDVNGRVTGRVAANAADDTLFSFSTAADGGSTTSAEKNGEVDTVSSTDAMGRLISGSLEARAVTHSWVGTNLTITPTGMGSRTRNHDLASRPISETHPEPGALAYGYNAAGRLTTYTRPGGSLTMTYDPIGRLDEVKIGSITLTAQDYESSHGTLASLTSAGVARDWSGLDAAARPTNEAMAIEQDTVAGTTWPTGTQDRTALLADAQFRWPAVAGAEQYLLEVRYPGGNTAWASTTATQLTFADLGLFLAPGQEVSWRVRWQADGLWAPWSPLRTFSLGGIVCALNCVADEWRSEDFCITESGSGRASVGSLIKFVNRIYSCQ